MRIRCKHITVYFCDLKWPFKPNCFIVSIVKPAYCEDGNSDVEDDIDENDEESGNEADDELEEDAEMKKEMHLSKMKMMLG